MANQFGTSEPSSSISFHGKYLGKCLVTDMLDRKAIKMATRNIAKQAKRKAKSQLDSIDVIISINDAWIIVMLPDRSHVGHPNYHHGPQLQQQQQQHRVLAQSMRSTDYDGGGDGDPSQHNRIERAENIIMRADLEQISSCFVLRENNRIVSIVVMSELFVPETHVFCLNSSTMVNQLVGFLSDAFQKSSSTQSSNIATKVDETKNTKIKIENAIQAKPFKPNSLCPDMIRLIDF
ncbi:hypothetical protein SSS_00600 [Sarcoptes scabiei]|uniref:Uncharacterized protein n=1 Tax=Sarcoptes scabiei TaxID=52283 RepID=A0A834R992_SARSC|nr:hypothetical protein SSS_00600 [Sarcoptes scabiei]